MKLQCTTLMLTLALALSPLAVRADLFDDAVAALTEDNLDAASVDNLGQALRGGLAAGYPQYTPGPSVLHGFEISTPCGAFGFGQGFMDQLSGLLDPSSIIQDLQASATNLMGAAISQLPMVTLCYGAPTVCDIVKDLKNFVNDMLQSQAISCRQAESMLTGIGGRLRRQVESKCVARKVRNGKTMDKAERECGQSGNQMRRGIIDHATGKPVDSGASDGNSLLVQDTLTRADAPQEIKDFANDMLGEVEIKGGGDAGIDVDIQAPKKRLHDEYESERSRFFNELVECSNIAGQGNVLVYDKRRECSLPGMAMPDAVLRAFYDIGLHDTDAYNGYLGKLASNLALVKLSWKVNETRDLLEEGTLDNPNLDEASHEILELRLARILRERDRLISEKETAERHVLPVMSEVMAHWREQTDKFAGAALTADSDNSQTRNRFGLQNPLGYGY